MIGNYVIIRPKRCWRGNDSLRCSNSVFLDFGHTIPGVG